MKSTPNYHLKKFALLAFVIGSILILLGLILSKPGASTHSIPSASLTTDQAQEVYGRMELRFEANQGQTDASVSYLARGAGYTLFLKPSEAVFQLRSGDFGPRNDLNAQKSNSRVFTSESIPTQPSLTPNPQSEITNPKSRVLRMKLVGADADATAHGANELSGKVNYFSGNDPSQWRTEVPTFARVRYNHVYPGIDIVYYGNQRQLEYDFVVAPGGDAQTIKLQFAGADKVEVNSEGELLLGLGDSIVRQPRPFIYQEVASVRREVAGGYAVSEDGSVGFQIGTYDASLPLVIDPTIVYSTYLGGNAGDQGLAIAIDSSGNTYVSGFTASLNFPTANALQGTHGTPTSQDAFVTKINAAGTAFIYSTFLGGSSGEQSRGLAVDASGNAYVIGQTASTDFPIANAIKATKGINGDDLFVTKLNSSGSALVYSTYLGGSEGTEFGEAIAVDSAGNAYLTGMTQSDDFPLVNAIQATAGSGVDSFVSKINAAGSALVYSSYLGGGAFDGGKGIAVDSSGNAYIAGSTASTNFPTVNPLQASIAGLDDAFVTKVNAAGTAIVYSTYLGGTNIESGEGIAIDSSDNVYITGQTQSTNFPIANAIQPLNGGTTVTQDVFITKLNAAGTALVYSTYLGGTAGDVGFAITVDAGGNAYIAGGTASVSTFPTFNALQCTRSGSGAADVFITKLNSAGNAFIYSTYLGGTGIDDARGVAVDSFGSAYLTGYSRSSNFPTVNPIQSIFGGETTLGDAFVAKIADTSTQGASSFQFSQQVQLVGEDVTSINVTVQRVGDTSVPATVDYATVDGTASERSDYTTAIGTLRFDSNEPSKTITILINEDSKVEGLELFTVALSNPTGGGSLACAAPSATIQINDETEPATNAIDDAVTFAGTHYHDFLNRQADPAGLAFWADQITACGSNAGCIDSRRTSVSTAFFVSIEFQQTGYLVFRFYKETFTDAQSRPRGMPRYNEFLRDTQAIGRGVVVGAPNWEALLEANRQVFAQRWVQKAEFISAFPESMTAAQFVDKLFLNAEVTPTESERNEAIAAFGVGGTSGRANALRNVADSGSVYNRQFNAAFVLAQYIGYLRRNPNDAPEPGLDYAGFQFWLDKMNQFTVAGEDVRNEQVALARAQRAEMVRAFIRSTEYRGRFGQP